MEEEDSEYWRNACGTVQNVTQLLVYQIMFLMRN
jgi:hypothetical protein